jgi:predicted peroxiredoxin
MAKLVILGSSGTSDPTRASIPFHIAANGAAASGVDTAVILAGDATGLLAPGISDGVRGVGVPPLADLLAKCAASGIPVYV